MAQDINVDKKDTVLVAGVTDFIGARLAEALCDLGVNVIGIDRVVTGRESGLKKLRHLEQLELLQANILTEVPSVLRRRKITHIVDVVGTGAFSHAAGLGLNQFLKESVGLRNLLDLANHAHATFVYSSSVDIYQGLASHENLEHYFDGPELTSYYSFLEAKRYGEVLCREYVENFDLDVRIARLPETYGPGMDINVGRLLPRSIKLAVEGKDLILDEEGSRLHQLLYLDDAVYGLVKLIFAKPEKAEKSIFYFINPEKVSTISIVYTLREILPQKELKVEFIPKHQKVTYPEVHDIDISRTRKLLKWNPEIKITQGLKETLDWYLNKPEEVEEDEEIEIDEGEWGIDPDLKKKPKGSAGVASAESGEQDAVKPEALVSQKADQDHDHQQSQPEQIDDVDQDGGWEENFDQDRVQKFVKPQEKELGQGGKGWLNLKLRREPDFIKGLQKRTKQRLSWVGLNLTTLFLSLVLFLFIVSIPALFTLVLGTRSVWAAKRYQFEQAANFAVQASEFFGLYQKPANWFGVGEVYQSWQNLLEANVFFDQALVEFEKVGQPLSPAFSSLAGSFTSSEAKSMSEAQLAGAIQSSVINLPEAKTSYLIFKQKLDQVKPQHFPFFVRSKIENLKDYSGLAEPLIGRIDFILGNLGVLLGYVSPQRYVVILQNNAEIRPTGGFIGSYAALTINRGKVTDFKLDDIYNPDGLLEEHMDPEVPEPIKSYMDVNYLGIRDSNWWPDFEYSMRAFEELYERATQEQVDGVFSLNLGLIQDLLSVTGPVFLEGYEETITKDNVFERAQFHSEVGFEPGSTSKKDFLSELSEVLLAKIVLGQGKSGSAIARLLGQGLLSREIMLYSDQASIQADWLAAGLAGDLIPTVQDYVYAVDSNVGGNKANFWVERQSNYQVDVDRQGLLAGILTISWTHRGTTTTWPNGNYKNYLRVYLPKGVKEIKVTPELTNMEIYQQFDKSVVAGLVEVPIDSNKEVKVSYQLPLGMALNQVDMYSLTWQNQPGMREQTSFRLNLPGFLSSPDPVSFDRLLDHPVSYQAKIDGIEML